MSSQQFTRRQLVAGTLGAGAWLLTHPLRAARDLPLTRFAIASDTHLGRGDSETPERQWQQAIEEINATPAEFVLHLGDVVDGGRPEQYPRYAAARTRLRKPIYEIPGNHDPVALFQEHVTQPIDRGFDHGGLRFLLLNNAHRDSHDGFFTPRQLSWLERQCREAVEQRLRIVICCHVPIHANKHPDRGWHVKPEHGQTAFYQLQQRFSRDILVCFHGHFHNGIRGWRDHGELLEVLCPSVCYNQDRKLKQHLAAGAADGFFVDELRPGFLLAELGNGKLKLRYKPLKAAAVAGYQAQWPA